MRRLMRGARDMVLPGIASVIRRPTFEPDDVMLIMQPDHLGDILLSQPAVQHLRDAFPGFRLVAVVGPWSREIAELAWPVDEVRTVAFPGFTRRGSTSPLWPYRLLYETAHDLQALRARSAVVLRPDAWWVAWLAALVAPVVATSDEPRLAPFATITAPVSDDAHAVQRSIEIASGLSSRQWSSRIDPSLLPLWLPVLDAAATEARRMLVNLGIRSDYVVIHPGSGAPVKEWPDYRWNWVARALSQDGLRIVATGSAQEARLCEEVIDGIEGSVSLAGMTTLPILAEVLRGAATVVGPDSGPLHLAVAVGAPTVHLFGPSDPDRYGPWGPPSRHVVLRAEWRCSRCGDLSLDRDSGCGCMLAIGQEMVIDVIRGLRGAPSST